MLYILAVFVPPLALLFTSYWLGGLLLAVPWFFAVALTSGIAQPVFVIVTWILIAQAKGERRHRELLRTVMHSKG